MVELPVDDPAGKLALLTVTAAAVWKIYLRLKHDHREDKSEARTDKAEDSIIENLRAEVERLAQSVRALSEEVDKERRARWTAEARIAHLEAQIRGLGHTPNAI